jgi:hypothetical protein
MSRIINLIQVIMIILICAGGASGDIPQTYVIPKSYDFSENYYYVFGSPDIQATIVGSNEFERGQTVTLFIDLMNKGKLLGFETDEDPSNTNEIFAAENEIKLERNIVDASGVVVFLASKPGSLIEVKSISQQVSSLRSGQNTVLPLKFDVTIDKKAKAGEYNLSLNLTYDYQKNVHVFDANAESKTYEANYWYGMINQNQTLTINVKKQADFEIVNTTNSVVAGSDNIIEITLKNTGEEEARDVKVIISSSDSISTTDDKAYVRLCKNYFFIMSEFPPNLIFHLISPVPNEIIVM